jgi:hypothetical protein
VTILISDANILIDVVDGRIVDPLFQLPLMYASGRRLPWKQVWKRFKT